MRNAVLVCVLLTLGFAPAPLPRMDRSKGDPVRNVLKLLEGVWDPTTYRLGESEMLPRHTFRLVIAGSRMRVVRDGKIISERDIAIQSTELPRKLKATYVNHHHPPKMALYAIEGDTLTLCFPVDGGPGEPEECPAELAPSPLRVYYVLRRVRE